MFDNLFTSSAGVWAGLIAGAFAIPILIHLINLVRHKTVPWAAMEFLLNSHKRNRNYIWLKQLLLLMARIAMLLLALLLLGQVGCHEDRISRLLGGRSTHHYVILDDSFSMAHRSGKDNQNDPTAFDRAKSTLSLIAQRAKDRQNQKFTLLRYSKVSGDRSTQSATDADVDGPPLGWLSLDSPADIENILVDSQFDTLLETVKGSLEVSFYSVGIDAALSRVETLIEQRSDENAILYVLSDFRKNDWDANPIVAQQLSNVRRSGAAIELIDCAGASVANLAVVQLRAAGNVRVAGSPLMMEVKVKNFGNQAVNKIQVAMATTAFDQPQIAEKLNARNQDLPTVFIAQIAAGETQTRRFPVFFDAPGKHVVTATINGDGLTTDDRRDCVVEFASSAKVLVIDDASQRHSNFLNLALNPTSGAIGLTGVEPVFATKSFLRDSTADQLQAFDVVFLLDVDTLDDAAVEHLETFCRSGGGVGFFAGPKSDLGFYNRLYRQGQGIYPIQLDQAAEVPEDLSQSTGKGDFQPANHPVFSPVNGQKTTLLDLVNIETTLLPTRTWLLKKPPTAEVIATVRGDERRPLVVTGRFGKGRVIACTTTAGPLWNNWARNATFPPIVLLMHDYLSAGRQTENDSDVQTPTTINVDRSQFLPAAKLIQPIAATQPREIRELKLLPQGDGRLVNVIAGLPGSRTDDPLDVSRPGVYDVWLQRNDGTPQVLRKAFNPNVDQSNLLVVGSAKLATSLESAQPVLSRWNTFNPQPEIRQASSMTRIFLILLTILLMVEQGLAYASSYHHR